MKCILLFGAGKSATVLIDFLKQLASENFWQVIVADSDLKSVQTKVGIHELVKAVQVNIENHKERKQLVQQADIVISLLPPSLHYEVAKDCILFHKHLLTASYADESMKELENDIKHRNLLFLCEMGLDPGIDHMSAMQLIHRLQSEGAVVHTFKSHCGGLVAPESDDNPWHYKISWNPRNIIMAGKAGAVYKENGVEKHIAYEQLFSHNNFVEIPAVGIYAFYPNRDSLTYAPLYKLEQANDFIRTTLRHPDFCFGWKNIIDLKLTDEEKVYDSNGLTIAEFFKQHFEKNGFGNWLNEMLMSRISYAKEMMEKLSQLMEAEEEIKEEEDKITDEDFMIVDEKGELTTLDTTEIKDKAAETVASQMQEANLAMKQLFYLGLEDDTVIDKGICSAADILQFILEKRLALAPDDKDMIIMLHEIGYILNAKEHQVKSTLVVKGKDNVHTAMAKTVGLPLGIAAKLILEGKITETGLHIPIISSIYEPVLKELQHHGIRFNETIT